MSSVTSSRRLEFVDTASKTPHKSSSERSNHAVFAMEYLTLCKDNLCLGLPGVYAEDSVQEQAILGSQSMKESTWMRTKLEVQEQEDVGGATMQTRRQPLFR